MGIFVTDTGFQPKTFDELLTEWQNKFTELFGEIDFGAGSAFQTLAEQLAKSQSDYWLGAQEIYTSRDRDQAVGTSLDLIAREIGLIRIDSSATEVNDVFIYGDDNTIIPAGSKARIPGEELTYTLQDDVLISEGACRRVVLTPDGTTGTYTITLDSVDYSYVNSGGDTKEDINDNLADLINSGFAGSVSFDTENIYIEYISTDFSVSYTSNLSVVELASDGQFLADITGPNPVPANSLTEIVTPVTSWDGVDNPNSGITGRAVETDTEFRLRIGRNFRVGKATEEAILQVLLSTIENVTSVSITSNRESTIDGDGRPANCFEVVISGGDDNDIANNIWATMPAGIQSFGSTTVQIIDGQGTPQNISFSRPTNSYIHVRIDRTPYAEESYPTNGDDLIKEAIVEWAATEFSNGTDVIRQRISIPVYTIPGTQQIEIYIDSTPDPGDTPTYSQPASIVISGDELAVFAASRIQVVEV